VLHQILEHSFGVRFRFGQIPILHVSPPLTLQQPVTATQPALNIPLVSPTVPKLTSNALTFLEMPDALHFFRCHGNQWNAADGEGDTHGLVI